MVWPILISLSVTPGALSAAADIAIAPLRSNEPNKLRSTAHPLSPSIWRVAFRPWRNVRSRSQTADSCALTAIASAATGPRRRMSLRRFIRSPRRQSGGRGGHGRRSNHSSVPLPFLLEAVLLRAGGRLALPPHRPWPPCLPLTL